MNQSLTLAVTNPNFSIVVPSDCNAKCDFCFWKPTTTITKEGFLNNLKQCVADLPSAFQQCSITGGEPTMCDWLDEILEIIHERFPKVVLSSNGYNIQPKILKFIDHLNLSRHHYLDSLNFKVFGTDTVASTARTIEICNQAELNGVDVTLNCVLPSDFNNLEFINNYVLYAKAVNANAVCFRKEHSDLELLPVESKIFSKVLDDSSCPACRKRVRYVDGMLTNWRYGVSEPTEVMTGIYEVIMQPYGVLTADWDGKQVLDLTNKGFKNQKSNELLVKELPSHIGCGEEDYGCRGRMSFYEQQRLYRNSRENSGCGSWISSGCGFSMTTCG